MKKLLLLMIVGLLAAPAMAIPSWYTGESYQTYQLFDFLECDIIVDPTDPVGDIDWEATFAPTDAINDFGDPTACIELILGDYPGYIPEDDLFFAQEIYVASGLFIPNQPIDNTYKDIWIQVIYDGNPDLTTFSIYAPGSDVVSEVYTDVALNDQWRVLTIEWKLVPNPEAEWIEFYFVNSGAKLDSILVYTQCIPAPGAILLGGIGVSFVGYLRRRRTL